MCSQCCGTFVGKDDNELEYLRRQVMILKERDNINEEYKKLLGNTLGEINVLSVNRALKWSESEGFMKHLHRGSSFGSDYPFILSGFIGFGLVVGYRYLRFMHLPERPTENYLLYTLAYAETARYVFMMCGLPLVIYNYFVKQNWSPFSGNDDESEYDSPSECEVEIKPSKAKCCNTPTKHIPQENRPCSKKTKYQISKMEMK